MFSQKEKDRSNNDARMFPVKRHAQGQRAGKMGVNICLYASLVMRSRLFSSAAIPASDGLHCCAAFCHVAGTGVKKMWESTRTYTGKRGQTRTGNDTHGQARATTPRH